MKIKTTDSVDSIEKAKNSIKVIAILKSKSGKRDELFNILLELIKPSREEPGNIMYIIHLSLDNLNEIMFDELWIDEEALYKHFQQPHMKEIQKRIQPLLETPTELKIYSYLS